LTQFVFQTRKKQRKTTKYIELQRKQLPGNVELVLYKVQKLWNEIQSKWKMNVGDNRKEILPDG